MNDTVYLIESYGKFENLYKIGFVGKQSVEDRKKQHQTGNPNPLNIIYEFKTNHGRKLETALKNLYRHRKLEGEWFRLEENDILNFLNLCKKLENNFDIIKQKTPEF